MKVQALGDTQPPVEVTSGRASAQPAPSQLCSAACAGPVIVHSASTAPAARPIPATRFAFMTCPFRCSSR